MAMSRLDPEHKKQTEHVFCQAVLSCVEGVLVMQATAMRHRRLSVPHGDNLVQGQIQKLQSPPWKSLAGSAPLRKGLPHMV